MKTHIIVLLLFAAATAVAMVEIASAAPHPAAQAIVPLDTPVFLWRFRERADTVYDVC